jgi:hypothetical protein
MVTRARAGIFKPHPRYANVATVAVPGAIPTSIRAALRDDPGLISSKHSVLWSSRRLSVQFSRSRPPTVGLFISST